MGTYIVGIVGILLGMGGWWGIQYGIRRRQRHETVIFQQCQQFRREREYLEAKLAGAGRFAALYGLPCWQDMTFDDKVFFLRDRQTGELLALVAVLLEICSPDPAKPLDICFRELGDGTDPVEDYGRASFAADVLIGEYEQKDEDIPLEMAVDGPYRWRFRDATAIFRYRDGTWRIDERVLSDSAPEDVIQYHGDRFRLVHESQLSGAEGE